MRFTLIGALAAVSLLAASAPLFARPAVPAFSAERMEATVRFLADDLLEGRDTGSRGHEIAARYVASRFAGLGLRPAGDPGSYLQHVTLQRTDPGPTLGKVTISGPGGEASWVHATEVLVGLNANEPKLDIAAPLIFVGYGIASAELGIDDYAGLDVTGKIVVTLRGFPKGMPSEEGAHVAATKRQAAQARGAVGLVSIGTLQSMKAHPWDRMVHFADEPAFSWVGADGTPFDPAPGIRITAVLNESPAEALFVGAPQTLAEIRSVADAPGGRPAGFALGARIRIQSESISRRVTSPNVVAVLPGSDPQLKDQYVVLSAHLDHLGIAAPNADDPPAKDRIHNGALDNAAGIATMIEVARAATTSPDRPRRSILFIATTAEEKGLIGADYFARHPTMPAGSIVGNVGLDMPLLLYRFTDVTAFGADHSTLGPIVAEAVAPMGVTLSPDPMAEEGIFTRSDHYSFVRQGIPAVMLATGFANGGEQAWRDFLGSAYHHPGDDMNQQIDWVAGARFAEVNYRIMRAIADADTPPLWYAGDFFGDRFAPRARKATRP